MCDCEMKSCQIATKVFNVDSQENHKCMKGEWMEKKCFYCEKRGKLRKYKDEFFNDYGLQTYKIPLCPECAIKYGFELPEWALYKDERLVKKFYKRKNAFQALEKARSEFKVVHEKDGE